MQRIEENEKAAAAAASDTPITIQVKFTGQKIPVTLSSESTGKDLKSLLQRLTNVVPHLQKLIFKGKILADSKSLKSFQITDGSKLMLITSTGERLQDELKGGDKKPAVAKAIVISRCKRWKATGIADLTGNLLKAFPDEVWECAPFLKSLDASYNLLQELPDKIGILKPLRKLYLSSNQLTEETISWDGLSQLKQLEVLNLNKNKLTSLSPALAGLDNLEQLDIARNELTCLPDEIGCLSHLKLLRADSNRLSSLPASIGDCSSLVEVDLSANLLTEIPETFVELENLKILNLGKNSDFKSLPSTLFISCTKLAILSFHNTKISKDDLRQMEGWGSFDVRRRGKRPQTYPDSHAGSSRGPEEGADKDKKV